MPYLQKVVAAVTATVVHTNGTRKDVLVMVEDAHHNQLTLPTGGKKATDKSLEAAARREFCEETLVMDLESDADMHRVCDPFVWRPDYHKPKWNERYEYYIFTKHLGTLTEAQVQTYIADFKTKRENILNDTSMDPRTKKGLLETRSLVFVSLDALEKLSNIWTFMSKEVFARLDGALKRDSWKKTYTGPGPSVCNMTHDDLCIQFRKPLHRKSLCSNPSIPLQKHQLSKTTSWASLPKCQPSTQQTRITLVCNGKSIASQLSTPSLRIHGERDGVFT